MADEEGPVTSKIHDLIGRLKTSGPEAPAEPLKSIADALKEANEEERTAHNNSFIK